MRTRTDQTSDGGWTRRAAMNVAGGLNERWWLANDEEVSRISGGLACGGVREEFGLALLPIVLLALREALGV